jgi:hypothetical protein
MKFQPLFILSITIGLIVSSCQKVDPTNRTADPNAKQHNEDVSNTKSESDNLNTEVNNALASISGFGKTDLTEAFSVCGASIDSSQQFAATPTIIFTFDGTTTCNNRIRAGEVKVELIQGAKWSDVGAKLRITHTNYKVTFPSLNNHYVTFNGTKYLTDVNGIDWLGVYFGSKTVLLRERSYDMTVTFENGQTSTWKTARTSEWGLAGAQVYATVNGDTTINGKTVDSWGVTRFNTNFITEMIQPWKSGTTCGWWKPTQGKYKSTTDNFSVTATFGTDNTGRQVSSGCAYGFKLEWTIDNPSSSGNAVLSYFW